MPKRCICEICNCGRHRCPHRPNGGIVNGNHPCPLSEYNNKYKEFPIPTRENFKPAYEPLKGQGPIDDTTTHRVDYIPYKVDKPLIRQQDEYKQPQGDMDMLTSYKKEYTDKPAVRGQPVKRDTRKLVAGKFSGEPTYKADYKKWDMERKVKFGPDNMWQPPVDKFGNDSTFTHDYPRYQQAPRQSMKPREASKKSDTPFDGQTDYRDAYVKHPLEQREQKKNQEYRPNAIPFDGLSTQKRDYQGHFGQKTNSFKPDPRAFQSQEPFEDRTTFKTDYQPWKGERPHIHEQGVYSKPEGNMDLDTTHKLTFREFPLQRNMTKRPESANRLKAAPFDGTTNYNEDYHRWTPGERVKPTMKPNYVPPNAPFEGISTFQAHYIEHPTKISKSFKPDNTALQSNAKFEDGTMYRMEYTPKHNEPCPAAIIDSNTSAYTYYGLDTKGHKIYQPIMETVTDLRAQSGSIQVA